ncbi:polyprotein [Canine picornavirus]|uniref:Genome polyprotein n=10 Tax=Canine picornavirus TaxID=1196647 RepID=H6VLP2_9PICO|nr:polyprotein [Canine picornavirus]AFB78146.1 polyprotein [Canine picornavirus]
MSELFLSKETTLFCRIRKIVLFWNGRLKVLRRIRIPVTSNDQTKRRINCGAAVSKGETGNKHQVAHAGGNITQINYYGSDYAQAHTAAQNNMDPGKFTKPLTDLALATRGPTLKSPNVEECGYSDRIMQITSGNSTITTQEAVQAIVAYGEWPEYEVGIGEALDKQSEPGPACDRFYTLDSWQWTNSSRGYGYDLPGCLTDIGIFGQNCTYHFLMRSGFCIHVQLNASKFHQGMMLVCAIPECQSSSGERSNSIFQLQERDFADYPLAQLTLFPHQLINLRTNNSATLILPYVNASPSENPLSHNFWTVFITPVVPLSYNTGATTSIPVTVSIAPMYTSFSGLRNSVPVVNREATSQGVPVFGVPGSNQFVTTIRNAGFPLLPDFEETPMHKIPGEVNNLLEVLQVDTFCTVSENANTFLNLDVTQQSDFGGRIAVWDMSLNSNFFASTYLARCTRFFSNYRGSVKLTLTFCGSAMATGKFLLAYTPPGGNAPTTRKEAMLATHIIWDVGLQSSVDFVVPWISQTAYRFAHTPGNVLSYRGYITMFYQTQVVVPPGAPSTCQITCMAAAAKDFVLRCPTDSAYFQGLGDDIGKIVNDTLSNAIQTLDIKPVQGKPMPDQLTVTSGDAAALTAPETGVTSETEPANVMETRGLATTFSGRETDISNFMSKYALFHKTALATKASGTATFVNIPLYFSDAANTQLAVRAKYRMFTYLRMGFDINMVLSIDPASRSRNNVPNLTDKVTVQILYSPPGCPKPNAYDSQEWYLPTTPSVFQEANTTPASVRLPFMGPASVYASFYNGYRNFNPETAGYGQFPGNYIGDISLRIVENFRSSDNTSDVIVNVLCYARPTNIRAFCPRPIVTQKSVSMLSKSKGRVEFVETDEEECFQLVQEADGTERRVMCGRRAQRKRKLKQTINAPMWAQDVMHFLWLAWDMEDGNQFHIIPIDRYHAIMPSHLYSESLYFSRSIGHKYEYFYYEKVWEECLNDIVCVKFDIPMFRDIPPFCNDCFPKNTWTICKNGLYHAAKWMGDLTYEDAIWVDGLEEYEENTVMGPHWQQHVLRSGNNYINQGWCGSPVVCKNGICGYASVSDCATECFFVCFPMIRSYQKHCPVFQGPEEEGLLSDGLRLAEYERRCADWSMPMDLGIGYDQPEQGMKEFQGVKEWCQDIAAGAGLSFGTEAMNGIVKEAEKMMVNAALGQINWKTEMAKKIIAIIIKTICAIVLIAKSDDKTSTAIAVGTILGVDLLLEDPFEWLKIKVYKALGIPVAQNQGVSEWIKEFNAACTAAKGLEWIGVKIQTFIQWVKDLFKREDPRRRKFLNQLEDLPILMEHIDKIMVARGKYPDDQIVKVCNSMRTLKRGADIYGVERNAATTQIVAYYKKAMSILQSMSNGRVEPVGLLIHGSPGSGKSLATEIIGRCLTEKHGGNRPYSLPPDPKHFDGYAQQPVVLMDDLGQNPDGEDCKLLCQMISSTEFVVPMAALEEKGMNFTSKFVLASTNAADLKPPTIMEPKALARRFFLDLHIEIQKEYNMNGKLDASSALNMCQHPSTNFKHCCPMICGKAVLFKDIRTGIKYTLDDIVSKLQREYQARSSCGSKLDAIFQGSDDEWFETDYDKAPHVLKTFDEMKESGIELPMPREIADLLEAVNTPEVVSYCEQKGWIIPQKVKIERVRSDIKKWAAWITTGLSVLASIVSLGSFIYMIYKVFAKSEGPYNGFSQQPLKKPELRRVAKAQSPDMEFINKLFKQSLFEVKTEKGLFTGLGLYDTWILLPKHSRPDGDILLDGNKFEIKEVVEIENKQGSLELVVVNIDRPVKFRDIRKYLPDHFSKEKDCFLVMNTALFPKLWCPVGEVSSFGFLNLSHHATYNTCRYHYPTKSGQCGGVICKSGKIIAMHIGGDGKNGYGAILTKKIIGVLEQGEIVKMKKAPKPINVSCKTQLQPSVFHEVFDGDKEPAVLNPKDKRLEVNFEEALFSKYKGNKNFEVTKNMDVAVDHYYSQMVSAMPENLTEPLSLEDVVYGVEHLEGLDLATSAGFPYVVQGIKKKDLIPARGESLSKLQDALALNGYDLPFVTYLKDELRPKEKVKQGKTRLIECASLNDTIRMKRIFGRLFQFFHANNGILTGSAVGCNPDIDWSRFYAEMGERPLCAFDYSNYDASMDPAWFECLKRLLRKFGYEEYQVRLIDQICNSKHYYKDKEYEVVGGMPSGCSGTSIFNSMLNNIIIRTLVLDAYKGINLDELKILAYGDDVIVTYPFPLDASILAEIGKQYGLTMTPPDKGSAFNEITWDNVTFLKRKFVSDSSFPFLIHPVFPMKEIHESARWTRSAATTEEHIRSLCHLAWHNGEGDYNEFLSQIRSVPVGRALNLPEYSVLYRQWLDSF